MSAYVIVTLELLDAERFLQDYAPAANETVRDHGGKILARGGRVAQVAGDAWPSRVIVGEFPTYEAAVGWYESPEYQKLVPIREATAKANIVIVEGL